jgi:hypothetical protein
MDNKGIEYYSVVEELISHRWRTAGKVSLNTLVQGMISFALTVGSRSLCFLLKHS